MCAYIYVLCTIFYITVNESIELVLATPDAGVLSLTHHHVGVGAMLLFLLLAALWDSAVCCCCYCYTRDGAQPPTNTHTQTHTLLRINTEWCIMANTHAQVRKHRFVTLNLAGCTAQTAQHHIYISVHTFRRDSNDWRPEQCCKTRNLCKDVAAMSTYQRPFLIWRCAENIDKLRANAATSETHESGEHIAHDVALSSLSAH